MSHSGDLINISVTSETYVTIIEPQNRQRGRL